MAERDGARPEPAPRWTTAPMFDKGPTVPKQQRRQRSAPLAQLWTRDKARLIEEYMRLFLMVTHHGTYIDGFAGWHHVGESDAWAAHRVLELEPRWLRRFYLFETDASKIGPLNELRARHHRDGRRVEVFDEDFNRGVDRILVPDLVPPQHAAFCLLDQYTLECHWSTLQKLADYKSGEKFKVELFYFLAHAWLDRTLAGRTSREGQAGIRAWWGRDDWTSLRDLSGYARAELVARRFREEFAYNYAKPYAIYDPDHRSRVMYYMIHAADHGRAPSLMDDAYEATVKEKTQGQQLTLE